MKKKSNFLIYIIASFLLILNQQCKPTAEEIKTQKSKDSLGIAEREDKKLDIKNDLTKTNLIQKYKAVDEWDTLNLEFTYEYQRLFLNSQKLMCFQGFILDIFKSDSNYIFKIKYYDPKYLAQVTVSSIKFKEIEKYLNQKKYSKHGCFIIKVSKILSLQPEIQAKCEEENNEEGNISSCNSQYFINTKKSILIFNGDLINFYLDEVQPN